MPPLSAETLEALSYVITTATEGGSYTRDDFRKWTTYKHGDTPEGFRAEVTVHPNDDKEGVSLEPVRLTPEELARRLWPLVSAPETPKAYRGDIAAILFQGDYGDGDVIRDGALLQLAVYGEVIYG
jgi:hypothetical protein